MPTAQPPEMPAIPTVPPALMDYIKRLRTWAYTALSQKADLRSASVSVLLQSPAGKVFSIAVDDTGKLTSTPVTLASGAPGAPVLTFATLP
jgi:hypothetical protein